MGKDIGLLAPHPIYLALGETTAQRKIRYRKLFVDVIPVDALDQIRECTNKSWVLGSSKFKMQIEAAANRRIESLGRGGDRKSKRVKINESDLLVSSKRLRNQELQHLEAFSLFTTPAHPTPGFYFLPPLDS